ncbi:unnamed protein product [Blepharisma stoltei]|uniref:Uncharacterized protein n=1 Tax=Blepharisma stoltei TaxID=1481888 RepID=A0AAU9KB94_9CILI|nr:unnamed protein product [Blepharisma stoltei]
MIASDDHCDGGEKEEFFDAFESPLELEKASIGPYPRETIRFPFVKSITSISDYRDSGSMHENLGLSSDRTSIRSVQKSFSLKSGVDVHDFPLRLKSEIIEDISFSNLHLAQELNVVRNSKNEAWIMKFSESSKHLAVTGNSGIISIYDTNLMINESEILKSTPTQILTHHTDKVTDLSWNQAGLLISASLDCTVRLWNKSENPIFTYQHPCPVHSVCFHPTISGYFATAAEDRIIRIFNITSGQVEANYKVASDIYVIKYSPLGDFLVAGLSHGKVMLYQSPNSDLRLRFHSILKSRNRSGFKCFGKKVTGLEFTNNDLLLITTNDSRLRLFQYKTSNLIQKYKGTSNSKFPISASFSSDFDRIICGSEKGKFFIWKTLGENSEKDPEKNNNFEAFGPRSQKVAEFSMFSPKRVVSLANSKFKLNEVKEVIFTISSQGTLKIFYNFN